MPATNSTTNLQLPQYVNTDEPKYIPDFNDAMQKIDAGYANNLTKINQNTSDITSQATDIQNIQGDATQALNTANQALAATNGLINIDDIVGTLQNGTITYQNIKVVNGVLTGAFTASVPSVQPLNLVLNYNISGIIASGVLKTATAFEPYVPLYRNGEINTPVEGLEIYQVFSAPWDPTWTKKEVTE